MINMLKKIFLNTKAAIYVLILICLFCIIGAFIVYLNPEGYEKIYLKPLILWLLENKRFDTFWIYISVILFLFVAISTFFCFLNDLKRRRIIIAIMHVSVLFVLLAHLISSLKSFKSTDHLLIQDEINNIFLPNNNIPIKISLKQLNFDSAFKGIPVNIIGRIHIFEGNEIKDVQLKINHPLKIRDYHILLKDITGFIKHININLSSSRGNEIVTLSEKNVYKNKNFSMMFVAANDNFSMVKVEILDNKKNTFQTILKTNSTFSINNENYTVVSISPMIVPAIIVDVIYDPSIYMIFIASSAFTVAIIVQALKRFVFTRKSLSSPSEKDYNS